MFVFRKILFCFAILCLTGSRVSAQTDDNPLAGLSNLLNILSNLGNNNGAVTAAPNSNQFLNLLNNLLGIGNATPAPTTANPLAEILNNLAGLNTIIDGLNINDVTTLLNSLNSLNELLTNIGTGTGIGNGTNVASLLGNLTNLLGDNNLANILSGLNNDDIVSLLNNLNTLNELINAVTNGLSNNGTAASTVLEVLTILLGNDNLLGNLSNNAALQDVVTGLLAALQGNTNTGGIPGFGNSTTTQALIQGVITSLLGGADPTVVIGGLLGIDDATISGIQQLIAAAQTGNAQEQLEQLVPYAQLYLEENVFPSLGLDGVRKECLNDLSIMIGGVVDQEQWALRMLDSFAKPGTDILNGDIKWIGSFDECVSVTAVTYSNDTLKSDPEEQFTGKYCRIIIPISIGGVSSNGHIGTCMPDSCFSGDLDKMLNAAVNIALNGSAPVEFYSECVEDQDVGTDAIIVICILVILGMFVLIGTAYDVIAIQLGSKDKVTASSTSPPKVAATAPGVATLSRQKDEALVGGYDSPGKMLGVSNSYTNGGFTDSDIVKDGSRVWRKSNIEKGLGEGDVSPADVDVDIEKMDQPLPLDKEEQNTNENKPKQRSALHQGLMAFSFYSNGIKVLSTSQGAGALGAINGIRFLSMAWVILGHTYYFSVNYDDNFLYHFNEKMSDWTFMAIAYALVSVDTFFTISGILVAYLTLKELKKSGGPKGINWFMFYFHRFWRLTPPYMLVIMVGTVILPLVYTGPLWQDDLPFMGDCRETWWTNLLYVNNYVQTDKICMGWTWYLANDMQFFIISPLIILPLFYSIYAGSLSCMIFLLATTITTGLVNKEHEYPAQRFSPYAPAAKDADFAKNIYFPSYARMGPYIIGLFTGYILYRCKCKCRIPKIANLACWLVCIAMICVIVYAPFSDKDAHLFTTAESDVYNALHRTGWGVAVCWIVFACATGYGGWINQILSWAPFIPLGRLTYCAYLVHPLVIMTVNASGRQFVYFTDLTAAYLFLGHLVMSYGVAFITSMFFESPMMGLEKAIFGKGKK